MKQRPPAEVEEALAPYRSLLARYRGTLDLMSPRGYDRLDDHVADALRYADVVGALSPVPQRLLDVGSGAGLPAVVVAAALPELEVELVERRRKRATFLTMALAALDAERASVHEGDVRTSHGPPVDVVSAQAVGRLAEVYTLTRHRHGPSVTLLSRKGPEWHAEVNELEEATGAAADLLAEVPLARRGTLVAVRTLGGRPCRSSA